MQLLYVAAMATAELRSLARDLSRSWRELGSILASRRLHASLHGGQGAALTPTKLRALNVLAEGGLRVGELAARVGRRRDDRDPARRPARGGGRSPSADALAGDRRVTVVGLTPRRRGARRPRSRRGGSGSSAEVLTALEPEERIELVRLTAKAAGALRTRARS